jgi:hypothetical protein
MPHRRQAIGGGVRQKDRPCKRHGRETIVSRTPRAISNRPASVPPEPFNYCVRPFTTLIGRHVPDCNGLQSLLVDVDALEEVPYGGDPRVERGWGPYQMTPPATTNHTAMVRMAATLIPDARSGAEVA